MQAGFTLYLRWAECFSWSARRSAEGSFRARGATTLVTHNQKHFRKVRGLKIVDWV